MENSIFRKKSIERVSSPEQLNDYIRVFNPGIWIVMAALIVLLIGVCIWGVFGRLETTLNTVAVAKNGVITVYIREGDIDTVKSGQHLTLGGKDDTVYSIGEIAKNPVSVTGEAFTEYALYVGNMQAGEWVYAAAVSGEISDGIYQARIVVESVSPMSFILN